ncbi:hypothetical protein OKW34_002956 [Paraburkholderia youngii]
MNVATAIEANAKPTKIVEPRVSSFCHPAEFPQTTAMFSSTPRDYWPDATISQALAMCVGVVAAIAVDDFWLAQWSATRAPDRGMASTNGSNWVTSLRFAPVRVTQPQ